MQARRRRPPPGPPLARVFRRLTASDAVAVAQRRVFARRARRKAPGEGGQRAAAASRQAAGAVHDGVARQPNEFVPSCWQPPGCVCRQYAKGKQFVRLSDPSNNMARRRPPPLPPLGEPSGGDDEPSRLASLPAAMPSASLQPGAHMAADGIDADWQQASDPPPAAAWSFTAFYSSLSAHGLVGRQPSLCAHPASPASPKLPRSSCGSTLRAWRRGCRVA